MLKNGRKNEASFKGHRLRRMFTILFTLTIAFLFAGKETLANDVFSDVSSNNSHYPGILEVYENGYMGGYPDGTFKPNADLTRGNVTKTLGKFVLIENNQTLEDIDFFATTPFNDVPRNHVDQELFQYSIVVKADKIFTGHNNNLLPRNKMTRQQMAKVLVNAFDLKDIPGVESKVTDNHLATPEFRPYIDILSKNGVTTVTNYRPGETVTRAQFATFLSNAKRASDGTPKEEPKEEDPQGEDDGEFPELPKVEPKADPVVPLLIQDLEAMTIQETTTDKLPKTVTVYYTDGSEKEHGVKWNKQWKDLDLGLHHLTGTANDTDLTTTLMVQIIKAQSPTTGGNLIGGLNPGLGIGSGFINIPPGLVLKPLPIDLRVLGDPYTYAETLMSSLDRNIQDAPNSTDAFDVLARAERAVKAAQESNSEYDLSDWFSKLDAQKEAISKWHEDTIQAKKEATLAINHSRRALLNIRGKVYADLDMQTIENMVNSAKLRLDAYKRLDKKASNTARLTAQYNKQNNVLKDLKQISQIAKNIHIQVPNQVAEEPTYNLVIPSEQGIQITWSVPDGDAYVRNNKFTRDTRFLIRQNRRATFAFYMQKRDVSFVQHHNVTIFAYETDGIGIKKSDLVIGDIDL